MADLQKMSFSDALATINPVDCVTVDEFHSACAIAEKEVREEEFPTEYKRLKAALKARDRILGVVWQGLSYRKIANART